MVCDSDLVAPKGHHNVKNSKNTVYKNRFEALSQWGEQEIEEMCNEINENQLCHKKSQAKKNGRTMCETFNINDIGVKSVHCVSNEGCNKIKPHNVMHDTVSTDTNITVIDRDRVIDNLSHNISGDSMVKNTLIDYTDTEFIVNSTMQGKQHIKKVNVYRLREKCEDLQNCLKQQVNAMGFLPINKLNRARFATSLKPNSIVTDPDFCPVEIHNIVRATGKHNFKEAKDNCLPISISTN